DRHPRKAQAEEHLQIIQYLEKGDRLKAADILRQHLEQARRVKINEKNFNNK
ncbi:MAG TPA: transcriptional regulator, partial [Acinetobacter sp.]|nr:transcriptional regulator [Acinetobacter sp.]